MKNRLNKKILIFNARRFFCIALLFCSIVLGAFYMDVAAAIETTFLYSLSNFNGPIRSNWANLKVDEKRNEIYVVDLRERDISIFNDTGMEVYRFGDDGSLGIVVDVAVKTDGDILVLSRGRLQSSILVCNFRGEILSGLELKNLPQDFLSFSPDRIIFHQGRIYLLDSMAMKIVVTDENGLFEKGYDLAVLLDVEDEKRIDVEIGGFSVDPKGNLLFTVPVFFAAYKLTPDGKVSGFGTPGSAPGRFGVVGGIVADKKGNFFVADRLKSAVLVFDKDFEFQTEFGYRGFGPENLYGPKDLALDDQGRLYVSQLRSKGVSVFKITYP